MALSRGSEANYLYYSGEPPPHEDHVGAEVEEPRFAGLVAAVQRSRAQVMALDILTGLAEAPGSAGELGSDWPDAPMTEAQAAVLGRHGALPVRELTWVQASLLIDGVLGTPRAGQARTWLRENGASPENAAKIIDLAEQGLRSDSQELDDDAAREAQRRRRQAWAQGARASPTPAPAAGPANASRRIAR